jgi:hypothetical protein
VSRSQDIADLRDDARHIRVTVAILRGRSARPRSLVLRFVCHALETCADALDRKADNL